MDLLTTHQRYRGARIKTFVVMWFVYVAYYLIRKNYAIVMPVLTTVYGWDERDLGIILTAYSVAYAAGQFVNGYLGDRFGAKFMLGAGLALSILANLLFPFMGIVAAAMVVWGVNGYAQSTGWPGCVKVMSGWFSPSERGTIMGFWCTCYQLGGVLANSLAAMYLYTLGWQYCFFGPSFIVFCLLFIFVACQHEKPEDEGLPDVDQYYRRIKNAAAGREDVPQMPETLAHAAPAVSKSEIIIGVLTNKTILAYGMAYFFLKFVRYSLLFWLPFYMVQKFHYNPVKAGLTSTALEIGGFVGAVFAGWVSDRYFQARRAPISTIMLIGLAVATVLYVRYGITSSYANIFLMALVGFMLYGPDSVMSGTGVMDAVPRDRAATAAGFVNGMGSIGQSLQGLVVGYVAKYYGWNKVFYLFIILSILAAICVASRWNAKPQGTENNAT